MSPRGVLVSDGRRFDITDVRIRDGVFSITATAKGPLPATRGPVAVFGEDGRGVCQAGELDLPKVPRGAVASVTCTVQIVETTN